MEVDARGATIELDGGIDGDVRANDIAKERVVDSTQYLKVGEELEDNFIGLDRKTFGLRCEQHLGVIMLRFGE